MTTILATIPDLDQAKKLVLITPESASAVRSKYVPHFEAFLTLEKEAANISVNAPQAAKKMRLAMRKVRTSADKDRKELGEEGRRYVEAVNEVCNILTERITPWEDKLEQIEKAEEIAAAERKAKIKAARVAELASYIHPDEIAFYNLSEMPEAQYQGLLYQSKTAYEAKLENARKLDAERVAAEAEKEAERVRLKTENDRLAKEAADRQAALDEANRKVEEERKKAQAEADRLKAENDAKLAAQAKAAADEAARVKKAVDDKAGKEWAERQAQEKAAQATRAAEAKKLADENARKQREIEDKAKADKAKLEAEAEAARQQAKKLADAEAARKAEVAAKQAEETEKARKAAAAPDQQKVLAFAKSIESIQVPTLSTSGLLSEKMAEQSVKFVKWLRAEAAKL